MPILNKKMARNTLCNKTVRKVSIKIKNQKKPNTDCLPIKKVKNCRAFSKIC
jgi:hypothetical protein